MKIKEVVNEGPITAIGKMAGGLAKLKNNFKQWGNGTKFYLAFKAWAKTPAKITDLAVVQEFARETGVPNIIVKQTAEDWKKQYDITDDEVDASVKSSEKKTKSPITDDEILAFFKMLHKNINAQLANKFSDDDFEDTFDSDMENILNMAKEYGVRNPQKLLDIARSSDFETMAQNKNMAKGLAILGYLALKY